MHEHSPEQVGEKLPDASRTLDAESDIRALRIAIPFFSIDGVISPEAVRVAQDAAAASSAKVRAADIDLSKTYTNEWVRER
jgi:NitT/TauT family transport system substrate-binding protein